MALSSSTYIAEYSTFVLDAIRANSEHFFYNQEFNRNISFRYHFISLMRGYPRSCLIVITMEVDLGYADYIVILIEEEIRTTYIYNYAK